MAAEALYQAQKARATGRLTLRAQGRTAELHLQEGALVGARVGFSHQTLAQALLQEGRLSPRELDELWSRGEGDGRGAGELYGLSPEEVHGLWWRVQLRQLAPRVEDTQFDGGQVAPLFAPLPGLFAVRACLEAFEPPEGELFRCLDLSRVEPALSEPERAFLAGAKEFQPLSGRSPPELALIWQLARDGAVELIRAEALKAQEAVAAPAPANLADPSWAEFFSVPEGAPKPPPPVEDLPEADLAALARARKEAEAQVAREVQEALRRSGALSQGQDQSWLLEDAAATIELRAGDVEPLPPPVEIAPEPSVPSVWETGTQGAAPPSQPLILGPQATARADDDLWKLMSQSAPVRDDGSSSFEEALQQVDAQLEQLVGLSQAPAEPEGAPVEAIIETTSESDAFASEAWPFDEEDLATDPSDPAEAARLRRQRLLKRAMSNLGALSRTDAPGGPTAAPAASPVPEASPAAPAAAPGPDDQQLAQRIEKRYAELKAGQDRFASLGLTQGATRDQVKAAFLELAKQFHPDRLPTSLSPLAPKMTAIFEAVRESYEVLFDDEKRKAYLRTLNAPKQQEAAGAAKSGVKEAEELYRKGELLMKKRDYVQAEAQYEKAYELDPKPRYLAARAWALYLDPARKEESARAQKMMQDAVRADPGCDRAHYQLGVIARVEGDLDAAERHFKDAVRANPKHVEASQELRLIEMRKRSTPKKGLFR